LHKYHRHGFGVRFWCKTWLNSARSAANFWSRSVARRRIELPARPILGLLVPTSTRHSRREGLRSWNRVVRGQRGALKGTSLGD